MSQDKKWQNNEIKHYTTDDIQNELLEPIGYKILREIVSAV